MMLLTQLEFSNLLIGSEEFVPCNFNNATFLCCRFNFILYTLNVFVFPNDKYGKTYFNKISTHS